MIVFDINLNCCKIREKRCLTWHQSRTSSFPILFICYITNRFLNNALGMFSVCFLFVFPSLLWTKVPGGFYSECGVMKEEIAAAVFFFARLVKRYGCLDIEGRKRFAAALTSVLFENYKNHWHPNAPTKGQAYRCLRMNRVQLQDPVLLQACERGMVHYEDLGLPQEVTVWVDPGEISCRYGEHSTPFCISVVDRCRHDGEFSRRVHDAVERACFDVYSGSSSDEEGSGDNSMSSSSSGSVGSGLSGFCPAPVHVPNPEPKSIPTVSNPNSVYRFSEFSSGAPQVWLRDKRKAFPGDTFPYHPPPTGGPASYFTGQKGFKNYRASFTFTGPRVDKYHWVSKSRS